MRIQSLHLFAAAALLAGCGDGDGGGTRPTAPLVPAAVQPLTGDGATAAVGTVQQVAVRVVTAAGAPVSGATVEWRVAAGGGSVSPATASTGADGSASAGWTLGATPGAHALTARVGSVPPLTMTANVTAGPAASLAGHGTLAATATVASRLEPAVAVRDAHGNPVAGAAVAFAVQAGGGTLEASSAATDAQGIARPGGWTLGTAAGPNAITASMPGIAPATLAVSAVAGPPAAVEPIAGDSQRVEVSMPVPTAPAARVADAHGNPVPGVAVHFAVAGGGGVVSGPTQTTDAAGIARVQGWTLGPRPGANALAATVAGVPEARFTAEGLPSTFNLQVTGVHLNQGSQRAEGTIGGVAGRAGLLRVVVRANRANAHAPSVRVRLYQGATLRREATIPAPRAGVPTGTNLSDPASTWNLPLTAAEVVADLRVEAVADASEAVPDMDRADNRFPRGSGSHSLNVGTVPPLRIVFIPVHAAAFGTGNVSAANAEALLSHTRTWMPTAGLSHAIRPPFSTAQNLRNEASWAALLFEIQVIRALEGATDEYFHGILPYFSGIPLGGMGYILAAPSDQFRSAISYDGPDASQIVAHELGHNLGRLHAPCGGPLFVDPAYPHPEAALGSPSYDIATGHLVSAAGPHRDFMSYCYPRWVSDHSYAGILQRRRSDPFGLPAVAAASRPEEGLLLSGRITSGGAVLEPALGARSRPLLPTAPGPHELRGIAADGTELFRFSFSGVPLDHGADAEERHFAFFVPLSAEARERVERIELTTPRGGAVRRSVALADAAGAAAVDARRERGAGGRVRVRWDGGRFPLAVVRDAATGHVLAIGRGGSVELAPGAGGGRVEVILSDGARSRSLVR